jgi:Na+/H+ antiporter NhaD/arsenite permease-like protein
MKAIGKAFRNVFFFYYDGFRSMTIGKKLWIIILIKLFVMFIVLKLFFFRDFLGSRFDTDEQKSEYVLDQLTQPK